MTIENIKHVRLFNLIAGSIFLLLAMTFFFRQSFPMGGYFFFITITLIALIITCLLLIIKPTYFYCHITPTKITIRYYYLIFNILKRQPPRVVEITKAEFRVFEVTTNNYGLTQELILKVVVKGQIVDYPPIGIYLLNKEEKEKLFNELEKLKF